MGLSLSKLLRRSLVLGASLCLVSLGAFATTSYFNFTAVGRVLDSTTSQSVNYAIYGSATSADGGVNLVFTSINAGSYVQSASGGGNIALTTLNPFGGSSYAHGSAGPGSINVISLTVSDSAENSSFAISNTRNLNQAFFNYIGPDYSGSATNNFSFVEYIVPEIDGSLLSKIAVLLSALFFLYSRSPKLELARFERRGT